MKRYIVQFARKHHMRELDTANQLGSVVAKMVGKRLMCRDFAAH